MSGPDVAFEALKKRWLFRFGMTAFCSIEEQNGGEPFIHVFARTFPEFALDDGVDPMQIAAVKANARVSDMRAVILAGLAHHHEDITLKTVAEIFDEIGMEKITDLLLRSVKASQGGGGKTKTGPRKAAALSA